jgi:hypothetical protein
MQTPLKRPVISTRMHDATSQKIAIVQRQNDVIQISAILAGGGASRPGHWLYWQGAHLDPDTGYTGRGAHLVPDTGYTDGDHCRLPLT